MHRIKLLIAAVVIGLAALAAPHARADFDLSNAEQFAVLAQFSNNQTNFNNGTITGDIGLGSARQFTASNGSVVGNIRFSGLANTSGLSPDPDAAANANAPLPGNSTGPFTVSGGGTVSGGVFAF